MALDIRSGSPHGTVRNFGLSGRTWSVAGWAHVGAAATGPAVHPITAAARPAPSSTPLDLPTARSMGSGARRCASSTAGPARYVQLSGKSVPPTANELLPRYATNS